MSTRHARHRWAKGFIAHFSGTTVHRFDFPRESGQAGLGESENIEVKEQE